MTSFTHLLKPRKHRPRSLLLLGLLSSFLPIILITVTREPTTRPSTPFDNSMSTERKTDKHWDLYGNNNTRIDRECLPLIFYDKPVKTGSTSVEVALLRYFDSIGEEAVVCGSMNDCTFATEEVCLGARRTAHLVHHVRINSSRVNCLHEMGYYHVTSIREPKERIFSAFKYNRAMKGRHNGIDHTATFEEFLDKFPRCALYNYYDNQGSKCPDGEEELKERAKSIVDRMDEVIDLSEEPITDVHSRIYKFIKTANVVSLKRSKTKEEEVPDEVAKAEYVLYNMLREKRQSLAWQPRRFLCSRRR